jgi:hypothetical protein
MQHSEYVSILIAGPQLHPVHTDRLELPLGSGRWPSHSTSDPDSSSGINIKTFTEGVKDFDSNQR